MSENTILPKVQNPIFQKKILYTLCFVAFCVIDWIKGSATGRVQMIAVNCTGFLMALIILSAYKLKDFKKIPYLVWTLLFLVGGVLICMWGRTNYPYFGRFLTAVLNVGVYGYIVIRLVYKYIVDKESLRVNKITFFLWCIMMLGMVLSRNDSLWPLWFLVMFGCFYLTKFSREEIKILIDGMINGLIIGFFLIQGAAFMFRPYEIIRYMGMYSNTNINGLFYLVSYGAFLCKWYQLIQNETSLIWRIIVGFFAGAMYGFAFLTMGKTTILVMAFVTLLFLAFRMLLKNKNRLKSFFGGGIAIVLTAVFTFPLVFGCVRYIPAFFHHPIWFEGEYGAGRIHSYDPIDSPKYIEMDEFLEGALGRYFWFIDFSGDKVMNILMPPLQVHAAENNATESDVTAEVAEDVSVKLGEDAYNPIFTKDKDLQDAYAVRFNIFKFYVERLNMTGHMEAENGVWLASYYFAPHAHNIFLQMMFSFGIPVGMLFIVLVGITVGSGIKVYRKTTDKDVRYIVFAICIFVSILVGFGILEINWRIGQTIFTVLFILQYLLCNNQVLSEPDGGKTQVARV